MKRSARIAANEPRAASALNREVIARAALDLLDEEGTGGLTLRKLASRLGVQAPSLYFHIADKDEILDAVTEVINAEVDVALLEHPDWRTAVREYAVAYRRAYLAHPHAASLIAARAVETDSALAHYDRILSTLATAGWGLDDAMRLVLGIDYLVLGSVLARFETAFLQDPDEYRTSHPALSQAVLGARGSNIDEVTFEVVLDALLAGLAEPRAVPDS